MKERTRILFVCVFNATDGFDLKVKELNHPPAIPMVKVDLSQIDYNANKDFGITLSGMCYVNDANGIYDSFKAKVKDHITDISNRLIKHI
ncbi:hypothetical protein GD1_207 [Paraglaciecola Antarctic GD virus 1]|nr:hypothetical protein GD1_207 [Paraglaciecola Antarctic GD virus 1]